MELDEILEEVKRSGNYELHSTYTITQAHSDILKWIKERLPPKMPFVKIGKTTEGFIMGHNNCRQQVLKNLGIKN